MRLLIGVALVLLSAGCAGPHSTGAVWAQQDVEAERVVFGLSDAKRAELAQAYEYSLVDEQLHAEQQRITSALQNCPGPMQPLQPSTSDKLRDSMRIRAEADDARLAQVGNIALADWYLRRANATGDTAQCDAARTALSGSGQAAPVQGNLLDGLGVTTVSRGPSVTQATDNSLTSYALGYVDAVTANAPLPQYLAVVYGGSVLNAQPTLDPDSAAAEVDQQASGYPRWEPDALYAALRGGTWP